MDGLIVIDKPVGPTSHAQRGFVRELVRNPLIVATATGLIANLLGFRMVNGFTPEGLPTLLLRDMFVDPAEKQICDLKTILVLHQHVRIAADTDLG